MTTEKTDNRSPIKEKALRDPGQSLRQHVQEMAVDVIGRWFLLAGVFVVIAVLEWCRWLFGLEPAPAFLTVFACALVIIAIWRVRVGIRKLEQVKLGVQGERYVGQFLQNELLPKGYWVIHDIPFDIGGNTFNVDHAVIGPTGVYAIETKTRSKPRGDAKIAYDGEQILVCGHRPDRDPIAQAEANARALGKVLLECAGMQIAVRPVVLFPGWYVERKAKNISVWVLNEKHFLSYLNKEAVKLTESEIVVLAKGIGRYVQSQSQH
jgi:hypothetical protein